MMSRFTYNQLRAMLLTMALGVLMIACSSDDAGSNSPVVQPEIPRDGTDLSVSTRSVAVDDSYIIPEGAKLWLALTSGTDVASNGTYVYNSSSTWTPYPAAKVWEAQQYFLYGALLQSDNAKCSITTPGDFAYSATLNIEGVEPVVASGADPLVIVGVQGFETSPTEWDVKEGSFGYMGKKVEGQDNVHLLLDHLYTALTFSFSIDPEYAILRTIKLKTVEMISNSAKKLNLSVALAGNNQEVTPITSITSTESSDDAAGNPVVLFSSDDGVDISQPWPDGAPAISSGCFIPSVASSLSVVCTYDVYDKASTPQLLATRKAVNSLSAITPATRGQVKRINLKVIPTYLYILSDNDLDNPTIKINSN